MRALILLLLIVSFPVMAAGDLPRRAGAAPEKHPGVVVEYGELAVGQGVRLRTILTKPPGQPRPPVVVFIQWLSCDTVEISPDRNDGWTLMLRGLVRRSGWAVMRIDKRGVGDSEGGPCSALDYDTELLDHRAALAMLKQRSDVDTQQIVVFGASMGSHFAPQVAAGQDGVVGVLTWGGGAKTWFERMLTFDRHALELGGTRPAETNARMKRHASFHARYLLEGLSPPEILKAEPAFADVWAEIVGASRDAHYGRPFAFHHQAQRADWTRAWAAVSVPVLVVMGEYDWFEDREAHETIVSTVNRRQRGLARLEILPRMDHHFALFETPEAAFQDKSGKNDSEPFLKLVLPWLKERMKTKQASRGSSGNGLHLAHRSKRVVSNLR